MKDEKTILAEALKTIESRRTMAKAVNIMHHEEIGKNIPEIAEINSQLSKTGMQILEIIRQGKNVSERINQLGSENLEAQRMIAGLLKQHGYPEDYLRIKYTCEKCKDKGFVNNHKCDCLKNLIARISAEEMNEISGISLCSFNTFDLSLYRGNDEQSTEAFRNTMSKIFAYCKKYAATFSRTSGNIFMFGRTGLGKTHLSLSIASEVIGMGYNVLYDSVLNYLNRIEREHFGRDTSGSDTLERLLSADLLILDDLGTEYDKPFYVSTIYTIINTRLNKRLPTIISSNLSHEEMLKKYDERIISRLYAAYESLKFVGKDIRLIRRKMEYK